MVSVLQTLDLTTLKDILKSSAVLVFLIISEGGIAILKYKLRLQYEAKRKHIASADQIEQVSLMYYRERQMFDVASVVALVVAILTAVLFYDIQAFSFLAVAIGAVVINQKENINSLVSYIFMLSNYNVGDDIRVEGMLGEIVLIRPLKIVLAGKEENGEYNGRRISVPNYVAMLHPIEEQELKTHTYRRIVIHAVFDSLQFDIGFNAYLSKIREFLDGYLPNRNLLEVGSFRSHAGHQYKTNFDYNDKGQIVLRIAFISRPNDVVDRKERIIEFIESLKKIPKES